MLNKLTNMKFSPFKRSNLGLYCDDGLAVVKVRGRPGSILEGLSKKVIEIFKKEELNITVEHGMSNTDFLDVRLDLQKNEYRPFRKENDSPVFIHAQSNHPPKIKTQIQPMINHRLSPHSSNEKVFNEEKPMYVKHCRIVICHAIYSTCHPVKQTNESEVETRSIIIPHLV